VGEKVKIKLVRSIVFNGYRRAGEIIETDEITAQMLVNSQMAVPLIKHEEQGQQKLFDDCG